MPSPNSIFTLSCQTSKEVNVNGMGDVPLETTLSKHVVLRNEVYPGALLDMKYCLTAHELCKPKLLLLQKSSKAECCPYAVLTFYMC